MQLGVVFPQTEIGPDPGPIRAYAGAVAELGYRHLLTYDHVVGADPAVYPGWAGPYDLHSTFHETFVLFGYPCSLLESRAGHRHPDPAAAPDGARRQAGSRS